METYRTAEERFAQLPGFPFDPRYREWQGMRLAHLDEGSGPPVVLLHGEPTWSFLWRKVMGPLLGRRVPLHRARAARLRPLGQAGAGRLVLV